MMLLNGLFGLCLVLVPVLPSTTSVSTTDFSGTWKIDKTSSTYQRLNEFDDLTFVTDRASSEREESYQAEKPERKG